MKARCFSGDIATAILMSILMCLVSSLGKALAQTERYALLIGISEYQSRPLFLEGPTNDVAALKLALVEYWGFAEDHIMMLTDRQASRQRILNALDRLADKTQPGDHVFIYFSGHGTSAKDSLNRLPLPYTSGALVPEDFPVEGSLEEQLQTMLVGRRDLRPRISKLDQDGRQVFVAIDSCYSGNAVRGLYRSLLPSRPLKIRYVAPGSQRFRGQFGSRGPFVDPDLCGYRCGTRDDEPYPYRNVFFMAAASEDEQAADIGEWDLQRLPTLDGRPHGAFTDALLRVLTGRLAADTNHDGVITYGEIYHTVQRFMADRQYPHVPQMLPQGSDDLVELASRSAFEYSRAIETPNEDTKLENSLRVQLLDEDLNALKQLLVKIPAVELVEDKPDVAIKRMGGDVLLVSGAGDLIVRLQAPSVETVAARVRQEVWIKKLLHSPTGKAYFNITLNLADSTRGITVVEGEQVAFAVRSEKPAYLLFLDIDSHGRVNVLYPYDESELLPITAGKVVQIPSSEPNDRIIATAPFGTDRLVIYGFERLPPLLRRLMGQQLAAGSSSLAELKKLLTQQDAAFARASLRLISVPRKAPRLD